MKCISNKCFVELEVTPKTSRLVTLRRTSSAVDASKANSRSTPAEPLRRDQEKMESLIKGRRGVKTPFMYMRAMKDKTYGEAIRTVEFISEQHGLMKHKSAFSASQHASNLR